MAYASARSRSYNSLNVVSTSSGAHGGTLAIDSGLAAAQHVLHSSSPLGSGPFPFAAGSGSGGNSGAGGSLAHIPWLAPPGPPHQPLQQQHHSTSIAHLQQHAQTPYSRTGYLSTDSLATFGLSAAAAAPPPAPAPPLSGSLLSADPPAGFHHHHQQHQQQQQQHHHQHHHSRHAHAGGLQSHRPLGSQSYSSSSDDMSSFGSLSATTSWVAGAYRLATGVPHGNGVGVNVSSGNAAAIGRYTDDTFGIAINTSSGSSGSLGSIYGLGVHGGQSSGRSSPVHHRSSPLLDGHADASNSLPSMFNLSVGSRPRALSAPIEPENLTDGVDLDVECLPTNDSMEKPMLAHDVAAALKSEKYRYLASPNGSASALVTRVRGAGYGQAGAALFGRAR